ncbi:MAG: Penicillin-binding protein 2 [Lentisphaerae bacterium ADurb.BinA184]|nr:MAG: Penicillin-binding protein 2 [Lentisphaerae bacterium ADurb.BinA184]
MQRDGYLVRLCLVLLILLVAFGLLAAHLYRLQIGRHDYLYAKARQKYTASRVVFGHRGQIYDANANLLAGNLACRDVLAEPRNFRLPKDTMATLLGYSLGVPREVLARRFASPRIEIPVQRQVDITAAEKLRARNLKGLRFVDSYRRYYPKGPLCANLIGLLDADGMGVSGVEALLDPQLRPTTAKTTFERDRKGRPLDNPAAAAEPRNGADVYLTIDEPIQSIVEEELALMVEKHRPRAAYAVMASPRTGAILAMAQYPSFDANHRDGLQPEQYQNRVLTEGFEPGSVMKAMSIAGALDFGVVRLDDTFDCEDGLWVYRGKTLRDSGHKYGVLSVWDIVQKSSNIGTAKIAVERMGENRLYQTLKRFGFGQPTGIGFADEAPGIFRPYLRWDGLSLSRFPIGQGILVTPLQLVQAYCALANGGQMMQLHVIDRVVDPKTGIVEKTEPKVRRTACRPEAARQMVQALKRVTLPEGTAPRAAIPGYEVAGKTGTAQKFKDGTYDNGLYVASFVGFTPADNPAFVLLVVADEPTENGYYGGTIAAPVFGRIAAKTLRYLQVAPAATHPAVEQALMPVSAVEGEPHAAAQAIARVR